MDEFREGGFLLTKIHQVSGRIFNRVLKENNLSDINAGQGRILYRLWQKDGIAIRELSDKTGLEKSTLTNMLDRMESEGKIRREYPAEDRRKVLIFLTKQYKDLQAAYRKVSGKMNEIYYKGFSGKEIDLFEEYLRRIFKNLDEAAGNEG